jgi:hypothetical protein
MGYLGLAEKVFRGGRVWPPQPPRPRGGWVWASAVWVLVGTKVWGFTDFHLVNYLIFREKVPEFSPRSLPYLVLFD